MPKEPKSPAATETVIRFAARLGVLRKDYGVEIGRPTLDMGEFADLLGLQAETYRMYERGDREPNLHVLATIRRVTGVSLNSLIVGEIDRAA